LAAQDAVRRTLCPCDHHALIGHVIDVDIHVTIRLAWDAPRLTGTI
jgi:hypothetical protein